MRKCLATAICSALLLATAGCHFHRYGHPHGMPPGQAKKILKGGTVQVKVVAPKHKHHAKSWK